jgi:hypothetical protein
VQGVAMPAWIIHCYIAQLLLVQMVLLSYCLSLIDAIIAYGNSALLLATVNALSGQKSRKGPPFHCFEFLLHQDKSRQLIYPPSHLQKQTKDTVRCFCLRMNPLVTKHPG